MRIKQHRRHFEARSKLGGVIETGTDMLVLDILVIIERSKCFSQNQFSRGSPEQIVVRVPHLTRDKAGVKLFNGRLFCQARFARLTCLGSSAALARAITEAANPCLHFLDHGF